MKISKDGKNHNKLHFYANIKGCFKTENYVESVSRNQRSEISLVQISAHRLRIEMARYETNTLAADYRAIRCCIYCKNNESEGEIDDKYHLFLCPIFPTNPGVYSGK